MALFDDLPGERPAGKSAVEVLAEDKTVELAEKVGRRGGGSRLESVRAEGLVKTEEGKGLVETAAGVDWRDEDRFRQVREQGGRRHAEGGGLVQGWWSRCSVQDRTDLSLVERISKDRAWAATALQRRGTHARRLTDRRVEGRAQASTAAPSRFH